MRHDLRAAVPSPDRSGTMKHREDVSVGAILLAAGQAKRMGENGQHKLLAEFDGVPLVRRSAIGADRITAKRS